MTTPVANDITVIYAFEAMSRGCVAEGASVTGLREYWTHPRARWVPGPRLCDINSGSCADDAERDAVGADIDGSAARGRPNPATSS